MNLSENQRQGELRSPAEKAARIRELNDEFRCGAADGIVLLTAGVKALPGELQEQILHRVRGFDHFDFDNDPHQEHDFSALEIDGVTYFWKLDYYDRDVCYGSPDPTDPEQTTRVLTVMLAEEY